MTDQEIKALEADLWEAADKLRANSRFSVAEYRDPVLGIIFLRYAYNRFIQAKERVEPMLITPRGRQQPTQDDY